MSGTYLLIAQLLYGTGMRLMECAQLRIKDVDFRRRDITIRQGKRGKDRLTMLTLSLVLPLREQLAYAESLYDSFWPVLSRSGILTKVCLLTLFRHTSLIGLADNSRRVLTDNSHHFRKPYPIRRRRPGIVKVHLMRRQ